LGEEHLRRILRTYTRYYNHIRSVIGQRCAGLSPGSADRIYQFTHDPCRTSSPLRPDLGFRSQPESATSGSWKNPAYRRFCDKYGRQYSTKAKAITARINPTSKPATNIGQTLSNVRLFLIEVYRGNELHRTGFRWEAISNRDKKLWAKARIILPHARSNLPRAS
jgi:hypothetical protein